MPEYAHEAMNVRHDRAPITLCGGKITFRYVEKNKQEENNQNHRFLLILLCLKKNLV